MLNLWREMYQTAERFKKRHYTAGVVFTRSIDLLKGRFRLPTVCGRILDVYNLELTNKCSCRCASCPRTYALSRPVGSMDMGLYRQIIDQIAGRQKYVILHNFGDPLLHPEIDNCIRYAKRGGLKVLLSTVGNMLNDSLCGRLLDAGPDEMNFSIDAASADEFAEVKGIAGAYDTTVRGMLHFIGEKIRRQSPVRITVSMVSSAPQISSREFKRQWSIRGVDSVNIKWFHTYDGSVEDITGRSPEKIDSILTRKYSLCRFPWEKMTVLWNGDVVPCCLDFDAKYIVGNVMRQSLLEISGGAAMQALRSDIRTGNPKNRLCCTCLENKR